jgi:putative ATPase
VNTQNDFFTVRKKKRDIKDMPLAVRMRPKSFDDFIGQEHIIGRGRLLRRAIESDSLSSLVLYGPPGTGKTALAFLVAHLTHSHFESVNAVSSRLEEIKKHIKNADLRRESQGGKTILFIDEIHRFNRAQQDYLLPAVEEGVVTLIGATTHNPFFSIISAILSRSMIFEFHPLSRGELIKIAQRVLENQERGLGVHKVRVEKKALHFLAEVADGDARRLINAVDIAVKTTPPNPGGEIVITHRIAEESIQKKAVVYDRDEDGHYNTASAFIKSMRGSDPDAAVYWLAKMLVAGEDPRFIARRIVICAAEDVGNADPQALVIANSALQVSEFVGLPECRIPLSQAAIYVACAPKSNASYLAILKAEKDVKEGRTLEIPKALQGTGYKGAKRLGAGIDYQYPHDFKGHHVKQDYLPEKRHYYEPTEQGFEATIKKRLSE